MELISNKGKKNKPGQAGPIPVRRMDFRYGPEIPRHWLNGDPFKSHLGNSFTLIFPEGEKFFIRSLRPFMDLLNKSGLKEDVRAFIGQESQHFAQHERFFDILRGQGYEIDGFLEAFQKVALEWIEPRLSDKLKLSTTAGFEHYTALLAELALEYDILRGSDPTMKALFEWHAAEELEHKAVAFDALQEVDDSYPLRIVGMLIATFLLVAFSAGGTFHLLRQDGLLFNLSTWKNIFGFMFTNEGLFFRAFDIFLEYFREDFHPWEKDHRYLAERVMEDPEVKRWMAGKKSSRG